MPEKVRVTPGALTRTGISPELCEPRRFRTASPQGGGLAFVPGPVLILILPVFYPRASLLRKLGLL